MATIINQIQEYRPDLSDEQILPMGATTTIDAGNLVSIDLATGGAYHAFQGVTAQFIGIAKETISNTGLLGAKSIKVNRPYKMKVLDAAAALTDVGKKIYVNNSTSVKITAGVAQDFIGICVGVEVGVHRVILCAFGF